MGGWGRGGGGWSREGQHLRLDNTGAWVMEVFLYCSVTRWLKMLVSVSNESYHFSLSYGINYIAKMLLYGKIVN